MGVPPNHPFYCRTNHLFLVYPHIYGQPLCDNQVVYPHVQYGNIGHLLIMGKHFLSIDRKPMFVSPQFRHASPLLADVSVVASSQEAVALAWSSLRPASPSVRGLHDFWGIKDG